MADPIINPATTTPTTPSTGTQQSPATAAPKDWTTVANETIQNWQNEWPQIEANQHVNNAANLRRAEGQSAAMGKGFGGAYQGVVAQQSMLGQQAVAQAKENWNAKGTALNQWRAGLLASMEESQKNREFQTSERLGSQDFTAGQAGISRNWQTGERISSQQFLAAENALGRAFSASEREATQAYMSSERKSAQDFTAAENALGRKFTTAEREAAQAFAASQQTQQQTWASGENALNREANINAADTEWDRWLKQWELQNMPATNTSGKIEQIPVEGLEGSQYSYNPETGLASFTNANGEQFQASVPAVSSWIYSQTHGYKDAASYLVQRAWELNRDAVVALSAEYANAHGGIYPTRQVLATLLQNTGFTGA